MATPTMMHEVIETEDGQQVLLEYLPGGREAAIAQAEQQQQQQTNNTTDMATSDIDYYLMCGDTHCKYDDPNCDMACLVKKNIADGYVPGNIAWVACMVSQQLNQCLRAERPLKIVANGREVSLCSTCGEKIPELKYCPCGKAAYCGTKCQREHWVVHKPRHTAK